MSILNDLTDNRYRLVRDLINREEFYDKKRNVLNIDEVISLLHKRFIKMQEILLPLKERLGSEIEIVDINFVNDLQDAMCIVIKYIKNGKSYYLSVSNLELGQLDVSSSDSVVESERFIKNNKRIFFNVFKAIEEYDLDEKIDINSASKKFILTDCIDSYLISDKENKLFSITGKHTTYNENETLANQSNININYSKIRELLLKNNNYLKLYQNMRFYESDVSNTLLKKLTNC